jgi:hypothetical protein
VEAVANPGVVEEELYCTRVIRTAHRVDSVALVRIRSLFWAFREQDQHRRESMQQDLPLNRQQVSMTIGHGTHRFSVIQSAEEGL